VRSTAHSSALPTIPLHAPRGMPSSSARASRACSPHACSPIISMPFISSSATNCRTDRRAERAYRKPRFVHQLLMRGRLILERLFPGIENELIRLGAVPLDWYADVQWLGPAGWMARAERGFATWSSSRDLLEFVIRRRVLSSKRVILHTSCEVVGLLNSESAAAAGGIRMRSRSVPERVREIAATLVVDASGRSSHMPAWLRELGYDAPRETVVNAFVGYASRIYRIPRGHAAAKRWLSIANRLAAYAAAQSFRSRAGAG
jgi:hypothetical protein